MYNINSLISLESFRPFSTTIHKWLILFFIASAGFSNAPGYKHHALTAPSILSFLIILNGLFLVKINKREVAFNVIIGSGIIFSAINFFFVSSGSEKAFNYFCAHIWMLAFIFILMKSFQQLLFKDKEIFIALWVGIIPSIVLMPFEAFLPKIGIDIGSFLPRVDRVFYRVDSGFGFFRVRGFNYESAYLAMLFNIYFCSIFLFLKRYKLELIIFWMVCIFLTASIAQLLVFFLSVLLLSTFGLIAALKEEKKMNWFIEYLSFSDRPRYFFWYLFFVGFGLVVLTNFNFVLSIVDAIYTWVAQNLSNQTVSANTRVENFFTGLDFITRDSVLGNGFGFIQEAGFRGLSSFYLALVVQLGVFSIPFFGLVGYLLYISMKKLDILVTCALLSGFLHLFIIDTFYLPQIYIAVIVLGYFLNARDSSIA
jgi:hypothetical protein